MSDLVEFLRSRLAEDDAAAKAVEPLGYVTDMGGKRLDEHFAHTRIRFASEDGWPQRKSDAAAERHFARHDPARVLREVEAKRAIVKAHKIFCSPHDVRWRPGSLEMCAACISDREDSDPLNWGPDWWPCLTLRSVAAVWSDHPDYEPEWKP